MIRHRSRRLAIVIAGAILIAAQLVASPGAVAQGPAPLVIQVDHVDPDNQQPFPPFNRLYEYTDFFSRSVRVHRGDTINFQTQPFSYHIVALARDEGLARQAYPTILADTVIAPGSGQPQLVFGDGNFPVTGGSLSGGGVITRDHGKGPPLCGAIQFNQDPCVFHGGDSVEIIGPTVGWDANQNPAAIDQLVVVDAPPGDYVYFGTTHPGMRGTLTVVPPDQPTSTQAEIDAASATQFNRSRTQARALETVLNGLPNSVGPPGDRHFFVYAGAGTHDRRVGIDAFLPNRPINAVPGDQIHFIWLDPHGFHTVSFGQSFADLPFAFGFECEDGYHGLPNVFNQPHDAECPEAPGVPPKFIGDPGNAGPGTPLGELADVVNSGLLAGTDFHVSPSAQTWSVRIAEDTAKGTHRYWCIPHPWMTGVVTVT